jgi:hypothetical protein
MKTNQTNGRIRSIERLFSKQFPPGRHFVLDDIDTLYRLIENQNKGLI